jgi:hypothetical protein
LTSKVTFEFVETTVDVAVNFLQSRFEQLKFEIDDEAEMNVLTLRVQDMELGMALRWIARVADATLVYKNDRLLLVANNAKISQGK